MPQLFSDNPTRPTRAVQIWQILIGKAHNRQTMTYGELAKLLGFGGAGTIGGHLDYPLCYCEINQLPPLTALVVNQETGLPGDGLKLDNLHADREKVYQFNWYGLVPPTPQEFDEAHHQLRG